jgi:hypothetical protein
MKAKIFFWPVACILFLTGLYLSLISSKHYGVVLAQSIALETIAIGIFIIIFRSEKIIGRVFIVLIATACLTVIVDAILRLGWHVRLTDFISK